MLKNTKEIVEERKHKKGIESEIKDLKKAVEKTQESVKDTGITERETRVVEKKSETKRIKAFMYVAGMIDDIPLKKCSLIRHPIAIWRILQP